MNPAIKRYSEILLHLMFLLGTLYFLVPRSAFYYMAGILLALNILLKFRYQIFIFLSYTIWLVFPYFWREESKAAIYQDSVLETILTRIVIVGVIYFVGFLIIGRRSQKTLLVFLLSTGCAYFLFYQFEIQPHTLIYKLHLLFRVFAFFITCLCFSIFIRLPDLSVRQRLQNLHLVVPFWNLHPVLPFIYSYEPEKFKEAADTPMNVQAFRKCSLFVFYLIILVAILITIRFAVYGADRFKGLGLNIENFIPVSLGIADLRDGFDVAIAKHQSVIGNWASVIFAYLYIYTLRTISTHISIAFARGCGFWIPASLNEPWKARTLPQFYGRILFHYNRVLMEIYFPLFKYILSFVKSKVFRVYASLFLGIFLGGFVYHFIRDFYHTDGDGITMSVSAYLPTALYFSMIAFVVVTSLYLNKNFDLVEKRHFPQSVRTIAYLITWSLVYSIYVATFHSPTTFDVYSKFMLSLIGL